MSVCGYVHVRAGAPEGWKEVSDTLEMKLQVIVSHLIWVLEIKRVSSVRAGDALSHGVISPAPLFYFF